MSTNIVKFDPFAEMQELQKQLFKDDWFTGAKTWQMPMTDIYTEDDKNMVVEVHLPYFEEKDITVQADRGFLQIQAEKHEKEEDKVKNKKYVVRESSSSFYRSIRLPEISDAGNIEAHLDNGVLKVIVPFKELPAPKKIHVKKITHKK